MVLISLHHRYSYAKSNDEEAYHKGRFLLDLDKLTKTFSLVSALNEKKQSPASCADFKSAKNTERKGKNLSDHGCEVCVLG
jgi:hypothetical protein